MVRVLVVDDDPVILQLVRLNLELEGHQVTEAEDGSAALERARESRPDVVVLDVMLPEIDGYEVCRRLREDPETAGIPVVLLSARALASDVAAGQAAGAAAYVTKPFDPLDLVGVVERTATASGSGW